MRPVERARGILDTSTVILLPRLRDPELLPTEPLITAVTLRNSRLARSSRATTRNEQPARRTSSRPRPTLIPSRLMPRQPGHSDRLLPRYEEVAANPARAQTTP